MKKYWRVAGLVVLAAGALAYPAMRLYKMMADKRLASANEEDSDHSDHIAKTFSPAYRGQHKPHRRKPNMNHNNNGEL